MALNLTHMAGFGASSGPPPAPDSTPNSVSGLFADLNDSVTSPTNASASNGPVTINGINQTITIRLTLTNNASATRSCAAAVDGINVAFVTSGTATVEVTITNGQTLGYSMTNSINATDTWSGTGTITNQSDGGATLDTFLYSLTVDNSGTMTL